MIAEKLLMMEKTILESREAVSGRLDRLESMVYYLPKDVQGTYRAHIRATRIELLRLNNVLKAITKLKTEIREVIG